MRDLQMWRGALTLFLCAVSIFVIRKLPITHLSAVHCATWWRCLTQNHNLLCGCFKSLRRMRRGKFGPPYPTGDSCDPDAIGGLMCQEKQSIRRDTECHKTRLLITTLHDVLPIKNS